MLKDERETSDPLREDDALTFAVSLVRDDGDSTNEDDDLLDDTVSAASVGRFVREAKQLSKKLKLFVVKVQHVGWNGREYELLGLVEAESRRACGFLCTSWKQTSITEFYCSEE